jgi:hypothetical protein
LGVTKLLRPGIFRSVPGGSGGAGLAGGGSFSACWMALTSLVFASQEPPA